MHFCPSWASSDGEGTRLQHPMPPALAFGKPALLSKTLQESGASLLPSVLRAMPEIGSPLALDPANCVFVGDTHLDGVVDAVPAYNSRGSGPRFSLRYTFVPRCPGVPLPPWVHPSLLEPDPDRSEGILVNGRVFPYEELHAYCTKGFVNTVKYQAEDRADSLPHVHVMLGRFGKAEEKMMERLVMAHVKGKLTIDVCWVESGSSWYRFTSCLHRRKGFEVLENTPRLFTNTGRGGLRAVYERLLRKHVLFYEKMSRGVSKTAFQELEREDVAEIWDKYGAKNVGCVKAVAKCKPPLIWADMNYEMRKNAKTELAKMPWKSSMLKPAVLSKMSWSKQHTRANARRSTAAGLSVPQIRLCATEEAFTEETLHYKRYSYGRQPILITDSKDYCGALDYEGVVVLGDNDVRVEENVVFLRSGSCDAEHADYLVQWFPLVALRCEVSPDSVHPQVADVAEKYSAICAAKARAAAERKQFEEHRADIKKAEMEFQEFDRLSREYEALKIFAFPGCNAGCPRLQRK